MKFCKQAAQARACAFALAAMTSALAVTWASGAAAQSFEFFGGGPFAPRVYAPDDDWGASNPRRRVRRALEAQGYELLGPLERGGRAFEARVEDQRGRRFRVIVDARTGQVIERFPLGGGFSGPPRPPRDVGPDRFDRLDRFDPYARPDYYDEPPPFARGAPAPAPALAPRQREDVSRLPLPDDRRLAPAPQGAQQQKQKPASRQARKSPAADKQGVRSARVAPATPQRQDRPEAATPPAPATPQTGSAAPPASEATAPATSPAASPAASSARNANLRRPDAPQRAPAAQAPAGADTRQEAAAHASRPAPRVVYPDSATSSATGP